MCLPLPELAAFPKESKQPKVDWGLWRYERFKKIYGRLRCSWCGSRLRWHIKFTSFCIDRRQYFCCGYKSCARDAAHFATAHLVRSIEQRKRQKDIDNLPYDIVKRLLKESPNYTVQITL